MAPKLKKVSTGNENPLVGISLEILLGEVESRVHALGKNPTLEPHQVMAYAMAFAKLKSLCVFLRLGTK